MADTREKLLGTIDQAATLAGTQQSQSQAAQAEQRNQTTRAVDQANLSSQRYTAGSADVKNQIQTGQNALNTWLQGGQASQQAGKQARMGAADVASQGAGTARASGLNAAQAAQMGNQAGGNAYSGLYSNIFGTTYGTGAQALNQSMATGVQGANQSMATGVNAASQNAATYGGMANAYGNQGVGYSQAATGTYGAATGALAEQAKAEAAEHAAQWSAAGSILGGLLSDETQKMNIQPIGSSNKNSDVLSLGQSSGKSNEGGIGDVVKSYAKTAAMAMSDKNQKTDIKSGKDMLDLVLGKVKGYSFNYKPDNMAGEDPNTQHIGVMAQDLEQTPLKSAVIDTPEGKMVDTKQMTMANTAMLSEMNDKVNKVISMMNRSYGKKAG